MREKASSHNTPHEETALLSYCRKTLPNCKSLIQKPTSGTVCLWPLTNLMRAGQVGRLQFLQIQLYNRPPSSVRLVTNRTPHSQNTRTRAGAPQIWTPQIFLVSSTYIYCRYIHIIVSQVREEWSKGLDLMQGIWFCWNDTSLRSETMVWLMNKLFGEMNENEL